MYTKYRTRGSLQWKEMVSRDIRKFNASQQGRYDLILKYLGNIKGKKVLDIGGGDAALAYCLFKNGAEVTVLDNEPMGIQFGEENFASRGARAEFALGSAYDLPFSDGAFAHVVCSEVIEHLPHPEGAIKEASRVLEQGGLLIATVPYRLSETPTDSDDLRDYFPSEVRTLLQPYFSSVEIKLTHHIFWYGLFTYNFRRFSNRPLGRWFINALTLWCGFNPFTIEYPTPGKFDRFARIIAVCRK